MQKIPYPWNNPTVNAKNPISVERPHGECKKPYLRGAARGEYEKPYPRGRKLIDRGLSEIVDSSLPRARKMLLQWEILHGIMKWNVIPCIGGSQKSTMSHEKILIIDDEKEMCFLVKSFLDHENYETHIRNDAESALQDIKIINPDLIILDVMLPEMSGIDLCLKIRNEVACPILFMSCKSEEVDKIIALSVGGDDYITKPFDSGELVARVKAHIRREQRHRSTGGEDEPSVYECEGLVMNEAGRTVTLDGRDISLTSKEFEILALLMKKPNRVFSREQIFELVWKEEVLGRADSKTVQVHLSSLRKKIEPEARNKRYIHNIRGIGYKFNENVTVKS